MQSWHYMAFHSCFLSPVPAYIYFYLTATDLKNVVQCFRLNHFNIGVSLSKMSVTCLSLEAELK